MRTIITTIILLCAAAPVLAGPEACYNIADADARAYCLARAHRSTSHCYSIVKADTRSMCLAEVRK